MGFMITGQQLHEWLGATMLILFVIHNILNLKWYKNLLNGSYNPFRVIQTVVDFLVIIFLSDQMISGIMMSRHVFGFLSISSGMAFAREMHLFAAYWSFILMSLHLGMHWAMIINMIKKLLKISGSSFSGTFILRISATAISVFGLYAFIKHNLISYMFLRSRFVFFDFNQSPLSFLGEYMAMIGLFIFISYYSTKMIRKHGKK
jgi:hypothetical protein